MRSHDREELHRLRERFETLTAREREVMGLVVTGMLNKQIAGELGTAEKTIKVHRAQVMHKMQADSLAELVRMADRLNLAPRAVSKFPAKVPVNRCSAVTSVLGPKAQATGA